ncbi:hypothetical protein BN1080_00375 [Planococcus massiliensis]|uniref:Uncharacterized protein n=1 Tax=Planococcus massiliensis TaxID=1499687 RepID=A0A098EI42_9BACL|nr:hypothetical protein [Planococcus massiliensis]CEG21465.1 hypothetical protein BN1080_00375 [Planococcus massiliensis]
MKKTDGTQTALDNQLKQLDQDIIWSQNQKTRLHSQILSNLDKQESRIRLFNGLKFTSSLVLCSILLVAGILFLSQSILQEDSGGTTGNNAEEEPALSGSEAVDAETSKETIQAVIEKEFSGPDEAYIALSEAAMEAQSNATTQEEFDALQETPVWKNYMDYMTETYASYFTENGFDKFLNATPAFMYSGFDGNYDLTASEIKISQNEHNLKMYQFTFQVDYKNANGEVQPYSFEGEALASEEGKIEKLQFLDRDGLLTAINEDIY